MKAARKAKREQVNTLRSKLLKFVQTVPVFMSPSANSVPDG